ncbi:MAG TPA: putative glycolipid-binding domain-containing protein [Gaiellaceae bacterium]|nr:putative glycolipid-binding domain-containing protein [Gaiellaceae bacterium]
MSDLPAVAVCRHVGAREGFEVLFLSSDDDGYRLEGHSTGLEEGEAWGARYELALDAAWRTRSARVVERSGAGARALLVEGDGAGSWQVDGASAPELAGCLDVDLEASAFTNMFPVRRLRLGVGESAEAPAVYVRTVGLRVERLEQRYARVADDGPSSRYDYESPGFDFACRLVYDRFGLVLDYPGLATRVA